MKEYKMREKISDNLAIQLLGYRQYIKKDLPKKFNDINFDTKLTNQDSLLNTLERLKETQEPIGMFSDCDSDGVNSAIVFYWALKDILNIKRIVICERKNGYGIQKQYYDTLKKYGIKYVFSADIGITAKEEVEYGKTLGIQSFITDHHNIQPDLKPNCTIINPKLGDEYWMDLCGCGIVYVLMKKLYNRLEIDFDSDLRLLHHATIGTIGDMVSLTGVNRLIVKEGLESLSYTKSRGLQLILDNSFDRSISTATASFGIVPMINSMNRIGNIYHALEFFLANNDKRRKDLYKELKSNNEKRKTLQYDAIKKAKLQLKNINNEIIFLTLDIKSSLCGLVSSWITNKYGLPSIVVSPNEDGTVYSGSGRGCGTFDGIKMLEYTKDCCIKSGGHMMAFGIAIASEQVVSFQNRLHQFSIENQELFKNILEIDKETDLIELNEDFTKKTYSLAPYGMDNPMPLYLARNLEITSIKDNGRHTFMTLDNKITSNNIWEDIRNDTKAVLFYDVATDKYRVGDSISIVFSISKNGDILINEIL